MANFIPLAEYIDILDEVGRWKVITLKSLYELIGGNISYSPFARRVRILEKEKLLKALRLSNKMKCIALTHKGGNYSRFNGIYDQNEDSLSHDLICSQILREFLKFENFSSGEVYQKTGAELSPDAVIYAQRNDLPYTLALEVELHQKSKQRVIGKLARYLKSNDFDFVLYIFNKRAVFEAYKRILHSLDENSRQRVVLGVIDSLSTASTTLDQGEYWHGGERKSFERIFK